MPKYVYTFKNLSTGTMDFFCTELFRVEPNDLFTLIEYTCATEIQCLEHIKEWKATYNPEAFSDWRVRTYNASELQGNVE
jgi:hypothetical protein